MKWGLRVEDCEQKKRKEKADLVSQNHSQMLCVGSKPHLHILGAFPMEIIFTCGAASLLPVGTSSPPLSLFTVERIPLGKLELRATVLSVLYHSCAVAFPCSQMKQ